MADDLDNLIRAAMKTLDEGVPSGYFEALPNHTLARLEGSSMQHGTGTPTDVKGNAMIPPPLDPDTQPTAKVAADDAVVQPKERDDDSGLHDIRNLAQSTKQRLSGKRQTVNPPLKDDDLLASSSGSFKNIALPQPALTVSLPEVSELPSMKEMKAAEKAAAKDAKRSAKASKAPSIADDASVSLAAVATVNAASTAADVAVPARSGFTLPSQANKRSKAPLFAVLGIGVAAAAGYVVYTQVLSKSDEQKPATVAQADNAAPAPKAPETTTAAAGSAAVAAVPEERAKTAEELKAEADLAAAKADAEKAEAQAAAAGAATQEVAPPAKASNTKTAKGGGKKDHGKVEIDLNANKPDTKVEEKKPADTTKVKTGAVGGGATEQNEESFDKLLKEAGVEEKKDAKPKLEKKSLTTDDFKAGMATIASQAQACYKGTQGTASVKLTIGPSGSVTKVTVGGAFAGKPEAACVEAAVKAAKFPPWDGGPQSFTYAYMLSD